MGVSGAVVGGFIIPYSIKLSIFIIDIKNEYMFVLFIYYIILKTKTLYLNICVYQNKYNIEQTAKLSTTQNFRNWIIIKFYIRDELDSNFHLHIT